MESLSCFIMKIPLLFIYAYVLFFILGILNRHNLHGQIALFIFAVPLFLFEVGYEFDYKKVSNILVALSFFFFLIILFVIDYKIKNLPQRKDRIILSFKPVIVTLLFIVSCILGIKTSDFKMHWLTGYFLVTLSFIVGIFLYRNELRFRKIKNTDLKDGL